MGIEEWSSVDSNPPISRIGVLGKEKEMETKPETKKGKMQLKDYVRWFFVTVFGLLILFTVIMAVYRKFGG
jgi:hypothetical protein